MSSTIMKIVEEEVNEKMEEYLMKYIKYNFETANKDNDEDINPISDESIREHIQNYIKQVPFVFQEEEQEPQIVKKVKKVKKTKTIE